MSDSTQLFSQPPVRVVFMPYNHDEVQDTLRAVIRDFGRPGARWRYRSADLDETEHNAWQLDFYFANPHDAIIFGLKYQR
jgi:hypothetical protein